VQQNKKIKKNRDKKQTYFFLKSKYSSEKINEKVSCNKGRYRERGGDNGKGGLKIASPLPYHL
jgi:hypothetical protein